MEKEKLIKDIEFGINATDVKDDYSVGMRNGMRWCLSLIDGKEPEYDKCENRESDWRNHINERFNKVE